MSASFFPSYMKCVWCRRLLRYSGPKAFSAAMRRHRKVFHPRRIGTIRYVRAEA